MKQAEKALLSYHASACRRSNNSFDASGIRVISIDNLPHDALIPAASIRALDVF
jgi:hypothetical protein